MRTRKAKGDICGAGTGFPLYSAFSLRPSGFILRASSFRLLPSAFRLLLSAFCFLLCLSAQAAAPGVIVLQFDNFSGDENAGREAADLVEKRIAAMGWRLVPADSVEPFLEKERIRYLDSLEGPIRQKLLATAGADAVVSGTLYTYTVGRNPVVAMSARMVRADGTLAWADAAGISSEDTERLLGFGRKTTPQMIADSAVTALMRHFPSPGEETSLVHGKRKPLFRGGPLAFRTRDLDPATPHLICILPFENDSPVPEASRVVADLLSLRLAAANGFEVVEPASLRAAALKAGIASFRGTASDDLARLAPALGTSLFLRGTIYRYGTEAVQIEVSLVDINTGRILWSAQHDRKGSDYISFLMLGAPSNAVSLTDRVVAEMIDTAWHGPASGRPVASTKTKSPEQHSRLSGTQTNGENR